MQSTNIRLCAIVILMRQKQIRYSSQKQFFLRIFSPFSENQINVRKINENSRGGLRGI